MHTPRSSLAALVYIHKKAYFQILPSFEGIKKDSKGKKKEKGQLRPILTAQQRLPHDRVGYGLNKIEGSKLNGFRAGGSGHTLGQVLGGQVCHIHPNRRPHLPQYQRRLKSH